MGARTKVPADRRPQPGAGSTALGVLLLAAVVGVAVVHLVLAPTALLVQRRARRGSCGHGLAT